MTVSLSVLHLRVLRILLVTSAAVVLATAITGQSPHLQDGIPMRDGDWSNDADKFSFVILGDKTSGGEGKWPIYDRAVDVKSRPKSVDTIRGLRPHRNYSYSQIFRSYRQTCILNI